MKKQLPKSLNLKNHWKTFSIAAKYSLVRQSGNGNGQLMNKLNDISHGGKIDSLDKCCFSIPFSKGDEAVALTSEIGFEMANEFEV